MKRIVPIVSAITIAGATVALSGAALASAATPGTTTPTHHAHHVAHVPHVRVRLNQAVRDGTITTAQKTAFVNELKSLRSERKAAISKTSTKAERQAERTKLKGELQAWATSNSFPLAKLAPKLAS